MSGVRLKYSRRLFNILIILTFLCACGNTTHYAPVRENAQPPSEKITHHIVAKGETLYSIAWRYNLDYKKLARANGIDSQFRIYPGQRLELVESVTPGAKTPSVATTAAEKKRSNPSVDSATLSPFPSSRSKKATPGLYPPAPLKTSTKPNAWVWPARGKMLAGFQSNKGLNKGIDIRGNLGEPVISAADGTVVYAGESLRGYGRLLIVKHSEKYLSAYAHNHKLLAEEGERVKQGQQIAEMGSSGTDSVKLHFEIRYDGSPVDPLKYLPPRN